MLTGHTKKMFEEWFWDNPDTNYLMEHHGTTLEGFYDLPLMFSSGVYLEFLREQGTIITMQPEDIPNDYDQLFEVCIAISKATGLEWINVGFQLKHNLGLTQAIEKCNELINGLLNSLKEKKDEE